MGLAKRFLGDVRGITSIEYTVLAALVAIAIMSGAGAVGKAVSRHFDDAASAVAKAGQ